MAVEPASASSGSPPGVSVPPASAPSASPPPASAPAAPGTTGDLPLTGDLPPITDAEPPISANGHRPDERRGSQSPPRRRPWVGTALGSAEVVVATVPAVLFTLWARNINVDPLTRVGQVSGLAALQLRFAIISIGLVAALVLAHRFAPAGLRDAAIRLGCALIAGLVTGLIAGGIAVAVRHTPWAIWARDGDNAWILTWAHKLLDGQDIPDYYPPLSLWALAGWSRIIHQPPEYALQDIQLLGTALYGPAAYLTWRLTLRPVWALAIGVLACLPFVEPVKPYPQLTLVMMIPVLVKFLHVLRHADRLSWLRSGLLGPLFGAGIGVLILLYSGWFVWSGPGVLVAALVLMPWRTALGRAVLFGGSAAATAVAVSWVHLHSLLDSGGATSDYFFYVDTNTEPAYLAMWRNDRPEGAGPVWPPLGELGGVGVFTLLLVLGAGIAIWFAWRRTVVLALGCVMASAWVLRMWLASGQYQTLMVRLYPRTTMILLYCLLVLAGFGVRYAVLWWRDRPRQQAWQMAPIGLLLVPLLFVFASAGSATANKYMPQNALESMGYFTWIPHYTRLLDGTCPQYAQVHGGCSVIHRLR